MSCEPEEQLADWKAKTDAATPGERYTRGKVWASYENMALNNWPRLLAAVESVLGLHTPFEAEGVRPPACKACIYPHPCPTVRAITDALGGGDDA